LCDDSNKCTTNVCFEATPGKGVCQYDDAPPCNDNNVCTEDKCDIIDGCVFTPIPCDDNNLCTDDVCDPVTGCSFTNVSCASLADICHDAICDPQKNKTDQCVQIEKICPAPADNNCTIAQCFVAVKPDSQNKGCRVNPNDPRDPDGKIGEDTDDQKIPLCHTGGCEVEELDCPNIGALAGGLAAGAIGGIAAAGAIVAGAALAGGAAAGYAAQTDDGGNQEVFNNPIYEQATASSAGLST